MSRKTCRGCIDQHSTGDTYGAACGHCHDHDCYKTPRLTEREKRAEEALNVWAHKYHKSADDYGFQYFLGDYAHFLKTDLVSFVDIRVER
jgi:hypothetical protein